MTEPRDDSPTPSTSSSSLQLAPTPPSLPTARTLVPGRSPPAMLISLVGLPFSGKEEIARWLVAERGFQRVSLDSVRAPLLAAPAAPGSLSPSADPLGSILTEALRRPATPSQSLRPRRPEGGPSLAFQDPAALLVHATENWRAHLVLTDPLPVADLDEFGKRPSFLLVRVDAGLMVRFQRCVFCCRGSGSPGRCWRADAPCCCSSRLAADAYTHPQARCPRPAHARRRRPRPVRAPVGRVALRAGSLLL